MAVGGSYPSYPDNWAAHISHEVAPGGSGGSMRGGAGNGAALGLLGPRRPTPVHAVCALPLPTLEHFGSQHKAPEPASDEDRGPAPRPTGGDPCP